MSSLLGRAVVQAHPSLALTKYWGKADGERNTPATPSLAVTLDDLTTTTEVEIHADGAGTDDVVFINNQTQNSDRFAPFFREFRRLASRHSPRLGTFSLSARSHSNFPASAGLASSSSGFAALAEACAAAAKLNCTREDLSALARTGSASAARSLWGGFTLLESDALFARPVHKQDWWPAFRIIVLEVSSQPKTISSRAAMEHSRLTSPYYPMWISDARRITETAKAALNARNFEALGVQVRLSFMRMFATMHSANPPVHYWLPQSLALLLECERMRGAGLSVWETMDAGPQVKILCLEEELEGILSRLAQNFPRIPSRVCRCGGPPRILES